MTTAPAPDVSPKHIALARHASLRAVGVVASARPWDRWVFDGGTATATTRPWMVITPDDLTIEIVFAIDTSLIDSRGVLLRLLADRWNIVVKVHPDIVPTAVAALGDLPLEVRRWDSF